MNTNIKVEVRVDGRLLAEYNSVLIAKIMVDHYKRTQPEKFGNSTFTIYEFRVTETLVNVETIK